MISDLMTRVVHSVTPQSTLREAADLFAHHHISGAPVLAGRRVVGVVTATDLLEFMSSNDGTRTADDSNLDESEEQPPAEYDDEASALFFNDQPPENAPNEAEPFVMDDTLPADLLGEHTVSEVMTRAICSLPPEARVSEAAQYMWYADVHRLLVLDQGHLVGILSTSDVARAVATHQVNVSRARGSAAPGTVSPEPLSQC